MPDSVKKDPATIDDVERIKRDSRYIVASALESNRGHIGAMKMKLDYGLTPEDIMARYSAVTPESIIDVANKYLPTRKGSYLLHVRDPLHKENE